MLAKTRMKETTKRIAAICGTVAAICGVVFGVYKGTSRSSADAGGTTVSAGTTVTTTVTAAPTTESSPPAERTITAPEENAKVPLCTLVTGVVSKLPADKALVVAVRDDEDPRIYFEEDVKLSANGQWRAQVSLGDIEHP
ncbi:hypothetical protein EV643_1092 [Kribbella sp. VKM Ac-2527]|uniref:Uncharacterized protein n=2 Tax=Kribbella caucasensis TaxID=2512215 RepID=A0A4R6KAX7_9ACTN|nr:hypothetical protein EV643_1092 [Kribbella sp. VKM Ac-2527]